MHTFIIDRIAMASPSVTTGRFTIASVVRIAACGWLIIGTDAIEPSAPVLSSVNVPPLHVGKRQRARPRSLDQLGDAHGEALHAQAVGVVDHRHNQSLLSRDRDPEAHPMVERQVVAVPPAVQQRVIREHLRHCMRAERQVGQTHPRAALERLEVSGAQPYHPAHVDLDHRPRGGRLAGAARHMLGDAPAQRR